MEFSFAPVNNIKLSNLCGVLDQNLRQIEKALNVNILRKGESFTIQGEKKELTKKTITFFYEQADRNLSFNDIQLGLMQISNSDLIGKNLNHVFKTKKKSLKPRSSIQNLYIEKIRSSDVTFGIGPAGTGKTYLAVACSVEALEKDIISKIILVRPAVEAGERLGFLPGDLTQKVDPYLKPLYDALYEFLGYEKTSRLFDRNIIEIAPLAFMRGRTLNNSFIILDEAQNTTTEQMKMFLTRMGFGSTVVITGDITQIDLPKPYKSGLIEAQNILKETQGISFVNFTSKDVVRHPLVQNIVEAYEKRK